MAKDMFKPLQEASVRVPADERADAPKGNAVRSTGQRTTLQISSEQLFAGANEVHIEHRGSLYRLQQTSLGKLILTK